MQLHLMLSGENIRLPMASQYSIQGLIYHLLGSYAQEIHTDKYQLGDKRFRLFTFGPPRGSYRVEGKTLCFPLGFSLEVRSCDPGIIQAILQHITLSPTVHLLGQPVRISQVRLENKTIFQDCITVKTLTPVTVYTTTETGKTLYFSPTHENFPQYIHQNALSKWCSLPGNQPFPSLQVETLFVGRKIVTMYKGTVINAWHGTFRLTGQPQVLDFLYQTGLGSKNAQGMGMIECN